MEQRKMSEILEENYRQGRIEYLKELKRKKRQERICGILIAGFVIVTTITLMVLNSKLQNKGIDGCMENGKSYNYCINHS